MTSVPGAETHWRNIRAFAALLWQRFSEDRCLAAAASLSYTSLLALVPLVAISFAILSAFPVFETVQAQIQEFIFENFLPSAVESVRDYLQEFVSKAQGLTAVGIGGLTVTALLLFVTIETAMNIIFRVSERRAIVSRVLVSWAIITLGPLLIGASFSVATLAVTYTRGFDAETGTSFFATIYGLAPTALAAVAFALFYVIIPNRPVRIRHALIGGTAAGILFSVLRWSFTLYITNFPSYQNLYGALATIPIFLFYMYLSWAVILAGAVLTATLPEWGEPARPRSLPRHAGALLGLALAVLDQIYRGYAAGRGARRRTILQKVTAPAAAVDAMLALLRRAHFADRTETRRWLPACDAAATTLHDLYSALNLTLDAGAIDVPETEAPWAGRLAAIAAADGERQRREMGITLRDLLTDAEPAAAEAALPVRRTPP